MLRRADEVRHQRQYLGFFEWVVWAVLRNVSVHMLFGSEVVDVGLLFGPSIAPAAGDIRGTHRVVACRVTGVGGLLSAVGPRSLKPEVKDRSKFEQRPLAPCWNDAARRNLMFRLCLGHPSLWHQPISPPACSERLPFRTAAF